MVLVTLLWSTAGIVTRQLERAQGLEVTCLRSAFNAAFLVLILSALRGPRGLWRELARGGPALWGSGLCWAVMFTAFMWALTLTSVANVLVTLAVAPLLTALGARLWLGYRLPPRTWAALLLAAFGLWILFGAGLERRSSRDLLGLGVALAVPIANAVNWLLLQRYAFGAAARAAGGARDFLPAVLLGALLSALATLPAAWPFEASGADLAWLAGLGLFQLAVPCLLMVVVARVLPGPELSLLALLEVLFGVLWAWWLAGEVPGPGVRLGGALVLLALVGDQALSLRRRPLPA
jgi:drug/metabolite transporter (DMT)-like permease